MSTSIVLKRGGCRRPKNLYAGRLRRLAFTLQAGALAVALVLVGLADRGDRGDRPASDRRLPPVHRARHAGALPAPRRRTARLRPISGLRRPSVGWRWCPLGWAAGWHAAALRLAFGAREWIAYVDLRWWPREPRIPRGAPTNDPLRFEEVARYSAVLGRRLLTYRLSKSLLTLFGPVGNLAAQTGRLLKWHQKLEPYVPHHLGGFVIFTAASWGGAVFLALRSGEPVAMVGAAGLASDRRGGGECRPALALPAAQGGRNGSGRRG